VLYVTHDQVEAMTLGQRIVVMRDGRIEQAGTPEEICARPATRFVAGFVGSPPMNFIDGHVEGGRFRGGGIEASVETTHAGDATLGVRPEHVAVGEGPHRARVEWIEDLGADRHAHLRGEDLEMTARLAGDAGVAECDDAAFSLDARRLHLFSGDRRVGGSGGGPGA
jgi:ABC-type sugar transport system ATPase subunit